MNATQRYVFDLQGYLVLKGVVPAAILQACNAALDRFEHLSETEYPPPLCLGQERSEQNLYISNIIEGEDVFLDLMGHPDGARRCGDGHRRAVPVESHLHHLLHRGADPRVDGEYFRTPPANVIFLLFHWIYAGLGRPGAGVQRWLRQPTQ